MAMVAKGTISELARARKCVLVPRLRAFHGAREPSDLLEDAVVAKCDLTGRARMSGNKVSHSNRKTRKVNRANIRSKRVFDPKKGVFVRLNISTRALRTLSRKGWEAFNQEG